MHALTSRHRVLKLLYCDCSIYFRIVNTITRLQVSLSMMGPGLIGNKLPTFRIFSLLIYNQCSQAIIRDCCNAQGICNKYFPSLVQSQKYLLFTQDFIYAKIAIGLKKPA